MRILVVGAGPTGLTLALAARQRGLTCQLIDKALAPAAESRALAIQARTLEVFDRLGTASRVLARARTIKGAVFHLGKRPVRLTMPQPHPRFPTVVALAQAETERILAQAGAVPERGVEFAGLDGPAARLRHAEGQEEVASYDWIVGCDGAHSTVRHALGLTFAGSRYPEQLYLADCRIDGLEPDHLHLFPGESTITAFFPLPEGLWRGIAIFPPDRLPPEGVTLEPFARHGLRLHDPIWASSFKISRRQVEAVRHGRVLLAGDAAHIHSPVGGQGMNLGIQDAFALAAALSRGEAEVERWAAERHAIAKRVLAVTDIATRAVAQPSSLLGGVRSLFLRSLAGVPALRARFAYVLAGLAYPALPD